MKQESLERANAKLNRVTIIKRGKKLSLRATLPPKHGDGIKPKRYTLSTGLPYTSEGLKLALAKAQQLEADLIYERFSWNTTAQSHRLLRPKRTETARTVGQITVDNAIVEFEKDYWNTREKTLNRTSNYKKDYLEHFLYLPQDEVLTADLLKNALLISSEPDSRKRRGRTTRHIDKTHLTSAWLSHQKQ